MKTPARASSSGHAAENYSKNPWVLLTFQSNTEPMAEKRLAAGVRTGLILQRIKRSMAPESHRIRSLSDLKLDDLWVASS